MPRTSSRRVPHRLGQIFNRVYWFITHKFPRLANVDLAYNCPEIARDRKTRKGIHGRRSFMHVGHVANRICVTPEAGRLTSGHLVGMFLHEFGHLATNGDDSTADAWVFAFLGLTISYRGPLMLEWANQRRIL